MDRECPLCKKKSLRVIRFYGVMADQLGLIREYDYPYCEPCNTLFSNGQWHKIETAIFAEDFKLLPLEDNNQ